MQPPATNDEVQRSKASWRILATEYFIKACLDQVTKERIGTSLSKQGWKNIVFQFNGLSRRDYHEKRP